MYYLSRPAQVLSSDFHIMDLAPLLLACRVPKLIRASMSPDMLRNLLPGDLWWLLLIPNDPIRCWPTGRFGTHHNRFAEEFDLKRKSLAFIELFFSSFRV